MIKRLLLGFLIKESTKKKDFLGVTVYVLNLLRNKVTNLTRIIYTRIVLIKVIKRLLLGFLTKESTKKDFVGVTV